MALSTLKGIKEIGGFPVIVMDELRDKYPEKFNESGAMDYKWFEKDIRPNYFVYVRHDVNSISFTLQSAPIGEAGVNGCQVDTLIETALIMIAGLNVKFPCDENNEAITYLAKALKALERRRIDRKIRGVEGTSNA